ncbi:MAG TPA: exopolysaccharide Pel transporter PelG [Spirochaetia bacterium]|nr:exopolysaccharide Pel transporter PelG [Spirochaetia bacterium]
MAGIGFELQRVLRKGGIGSFVQVAFAGVIIVAGPWLLSIVGIFAITRLASAALEEGPRLFVSIVVYSYAWALILFSGFHYLFTRIVADQIYEEKPAEAGATLAVFSGAVVLIATLIAWFAARHMEVGYLTRPELFRVSAAALFPAINLLWIMMLFVSMLKRFGGIFFAYMGGMVISITGAIVLGRRMGLGGAMLGFTCGQFAAALSLASLLLRKYRPAGFARVPGIVARYFVRYRFLFFSGVLYYWGIWADKVVMWITIGTAPAGTFMRLYDRYDIPVYLASLTMIPGLVYFVVILETDFYLKLMRFLKELQRGILRSVQQRKYELIADMRRGLREQSMFQAVITVGLLLLAGTLLPSLGFSGVSETTFRILLAAVYFHFTFLTLLTFLFYMEVYTHAAFASLVFFLINLGVSIALVAAGRQELQGLGYLAGGVAGSAVAFYFLDTLVRRIDRLVLARYSEG